MAWVPYHGNAVELSQELGLSELPRSLSQDWCLGYLIMGQVSSCSAGILKSLYFQIPWCGTGSSYLEALFSDFWALGTEKLPRTYKSCKGKGKAYRGVKEAVNFKSIILKITFLYFPPPRIHVKGNYIFLSHKGKGGIRISEFLQENTLLISFHACQCHCPVAGACSDAVCG